MADIQQQNDDPIQRLHDDIMEARVDLKKLFQKSEPSPRALATQVEGTVLALLQEAVVQMAQLRDGLITYVEERVEAEETQIEPEHVKVFMELVEGTRLLIAEVRKGSTLTKEADASLTALEAKAAEAEQICLECGMDEDEEDDGAEGEGDDSEEERDEETN